MEEVTKMKSSILVICIARFSWYKDEDIYLIGPKYDQHLIFLSHEKRTPPSDFYGNHEP